jgi:hypothetical protein
LLGTVPDSGTKFFETLWYQVDDAYLCLSYISGSSSVNRKTRFQITNYYYGEKVITDLWRMDNDRFKKKSALQKQKGVDHSKRGCGFETSLSLLCGRREKIF